MSKKEIIGAIERTIEEARTYEKQNPEDSAGRMAIDEYRRGLEARLDLYDAAHPGPLRAIATSIISPVSYVLAPAIVLGFLAYAGGRKIYETIKNRTKK